MCYTYGGITKAHNYTYKKYGVSNTTTYANGAVKARTLNDRAQINATTLTLPNSNVFTTNTNYYTFTGSDNSHYATNAISEYENVNIDRNFTYSYDNNTGNISAVADSVKGNVYYEYDEIG